jgi:hypothetical protein
VLALKTDIFIFMNLYQTPRPTPFASIPYLDITIYSGASINLTFHVKELNSLNEEVPFNLLGWYIRFIVSDLFTKQSDHPGDNFIMEDEQHGIVTSHLTPTDTENIFDGLSYRAEVFNYIDTYPFVYGRIKLLNPMF